MFQSAKALVFQRFQSCNVRNLKLKGSRVSRLVGFQGCRVQKFQKFPRSQASGFNSSKSSRLPPSVFQSFEAPRPQVLRASRFRFRSQGPGLEGPTCQYKNSKFQGSPKVPRFSSSKVQGLQGFQGKISTRFEGSNVPIFRVPGTLQFQNVPHTPKFQGSRVPRFQNSTPPGSRFQGYEL